MALINTRGEVVALGERKIRITMVGAVIGEEGETLLPKSTHTVSESFGRALIRRGKAVEAAAKAEDKGGK
ncbi:MAG TPA: hypothetical protein VF188_08270 [Longimicrobiales bacterium]